MNKYFKPTTEIETVYNEDNQDFIIVECACGHRHKINYHQDNLIRQINRGCIYCKDYKDIVLMEASYNLNRMLLSEFIKRIPEAAVLKNYEFYDMETHREILPTELTLCSTVPIEIRLKNKKKDTLEIIGNPHINCIASLFYADMFPMYKVKKKNGVIVPYIKGMKMNNYTYYLDDCNTPVTKEMIELAEQYDFGYCLHDIPNRKEKAPELDKILNEPALSKRAELAHRKALSIRVFKRKYRGK